MKGLTKLLLYIVVLTVISVGTVEVIEGNIEGIKANMKTREVLR